MTVVVGIDLGTSNSALAFTEDEQVSTLEIAQVESPGQVARHVTMPSALYLPLANEISAEECRLPWQRTGEPDAVVGRWARTRGAETPDRVITSAKSWLCHRGIDRRSPCLPWKSEITHKLSPVDTAARYLSHLWHAYQDAHEQIPDRIVITVPASFDEVARSLTQEAALQSGLPGDRLTLLEEPQAALYAWIDANQKSWREQVQTGDVILVCDIGGGTTDLSLITVAEEGGELVLERVAVGDHLLLGGDNMDLALAYRLRIEFEDRGVELDHWQFLSLIAGARVAKEGLLADAEVDSLPISVASRGASLFAQTLSTQLTRAQIEETILEGFFPKTDRNDKPEQAQAAGFQEFGLHYETEPAMSRHLGQFLRRSALNVMSDPERQQALQGYLQDGMLMPTKILFNGGVFKADILRRRVLEILQSWTTNAQSVQELKGAEFDLAVARGATYYGNIRLGGKGLRIRAGTSRSYYVGVEAAMPAVPGIKPPLRGLCVVPQGTEEGTDLPPLDKQFGLVVGQPVRFRFFSSLVRAGDSVGAVVASADRELDETDSLAVTLPAGDNEIGELIPVRMGAVVTETGTLQLTMQHVHDDRKWNLEFNVRGHES